MVFKNDPSFKYRYRLLTTRFTNETYEELQRFKENNNLIGKSLFNIPIKLRFTNVSYEYPMIVLEMNNSENELMGMGFIINRTYGMNNSYNVHKNKNYNRYTYKSRFYISFNKRSNDYISYIGNNEEYVSLIKELTQICFYGKGHLKRGSSFMCVPMKKITNKMNELFMDIFLEKYVSEEDKNLILNLTTIKELKEETKYNILNS